MSEQMKKNKNFVDDAIEDLLEKAVSAEAGSDQQERLIKEVATLYGARQKDIENQLEREEKLKARKNDNRNFWIKLGVDGGLVLLGIMVDIAMWNDGMRFETEGIFTSNLFRKFWNTKMFKRKQPN